MATGPYRLEIISASALPHQGPHDRAHPDMQMTLLHRRFRRLEQQDLLPGEIRLERVGRIEQRRVAGAAARAGRLPLDLLGAEGFKDEEAAGPERGERFSVQGAPLELGEMQEDQGDEVVARLPASPIAARRPGPH